MNQSIWLSRLLVVGAVIETLAGLGLLAFPSPLASLLLGESLSDAGLVIARLAGGGLLALGIACWYARSTPVSPAGVGVAIGFLVYNVVACITLAVAQPAPTSGLLVRGTSVLHGLLGIAVLAALLTSGKRPRVV